MAIGSAARRCDMAQYSMWLQAAATAFRLKPEATPLSSSVWLPPSGGRLGEAIHRLATVVQIQRASISKITPMPELPDVELYRGALTARVSRQHIDAVRIGNPFVVRTYDPPIDAVVGR